MLLLVLLEFSFLKIPPHMVLGNIFVYSMYVGKNEEEKLTFHHFGENNHIWPNCNNLHVATRIENTSKLKISSSHFHAMNIEHHTLTSLMTWKKLFYIYNCLFPISSSLPFLLKHKCITLVMGNAR